MIVQECEVLAQSSKQYVDCAGKFLRTGTSKNKGIGMFPKNRNMVKALSWNGQYKIEGLLNKSPHGVSPCVLLLRSTSALALFVKTVPALMSGAIESTVYFLML